MGVPTLLGMMKDPKKARILDAGAGTGNYTFALHDQVGEILAFEVNDGMVHQMRSKLKEKGIDNVTSIQGSITGDMKELSDD